MPKEATSFYGVYFPVNRAGQKKYWSRIGSASVFNGQFGTSVAITVDSVPLNWNGEFFLFPKSARTLEEGEEKT